MKQNKLSITIGIPAYNEEANVGVLITSLLAQSKQYYRLDAIVVNSDGSSDNTVNIVKAISKRNRAVRIIDNKDRKGAAIRQNEIIKLTASDALILINADVIPQDSGLIDKLIKPIYEGRADMTSPNTKPLAPKTLLERILYFSVTMKNRLFDAVNGGNNIYTCRGAMRCFSKAVYTNLRFERSVDEDAYSYLACITSGKTYYYVPGAVIMYKLSDTLSDHVHQSNRFLGTKTDLYHRFGESVVKKSYEIPVSLVLSVCLSSFLKNPLYFCGYICILIYCKIHTVFHSNPKDLWTMSKSSKNLTHI